MWGTFNNSQLKFPCPSGGGIFVCRRGLFAIDFLRESFRGGAAQRFTPGTYAVGRFLAGAVREKSSEIQTVHRKCVSPAYLQNSIHARGAMDDVLQWSAVTLVGMALWALAIALRQNTARWHVQVPSARLDQSASHSNPQAASTPEAAETLAKVPDAAIRLTYRGVSYLRWR